MIDLSPRDVLHLRALGVRLDEMPEMCEACRGRVKLARESERRAWREAQRWGLWGWLGLFCAAASLLAQLIAMMARRGGW